MGAKVSVRERRFVEEYLVDHNGSQAIVRAGFKGSRPDVAASKMLARPAVAELLEKRTEQKLRGAGVRADRVLGELAAIAFSDLRRAYGDDGALLPPNEWPDDVAAAIAGVDVDELFEGRGEDRRRTGDRVRVRRFDKVRALELLAKHLKLLTEKHEHTGKDGAPLAAAGVPVTKDEFRDIARELLASV